MTESQAVEGYGCACGFKTDDLNIFRRHQREEGQKEPGVHKSRGRVNLLTDEVILPPWRERTAAQRAVSKFGKKTDKTPKREKDESTVRQTDQLNIASEIKFVPRVLTCTLTPIILSSKVAAQREWGWREDMPLENHLDTVIYNYFFEHGIRLGSYTVEEEKEEEESHAS